MKSISCLRIDSGIWSRVAFEHADFIPMNVVETRDGIVLFNKLSSTFDVLVVDRKCPALMHHFEEGVVVKARAERIANHIMYHDFALDFSK